MNLTGLVHLVEGLLLSRLIFAASLGEQFIEGDALPSSKKSAIINKGIVETVITVIYSAVETAQPTTSFVESTFLEVVTITPSEQVTTIFAIPENTPSNFQYTQSISKYCLICQNQYYSHLSDKSSSLKTFLSTNHNITSSTTLPTAIIGTTTTQDNLLIENTFTQPKEIPTASNIGATSCYSGECTLNAVASPNDTNSTTTLFTSTSSALTDKITESPKKSSLKHQSKGTSSALISHPVTSYHYFNSAGPRLMLKLPFLSIVLLFGHISF